MGVYGESEHQLDDKGRINVPRRFQSLFEHGGGFLTRDFNNQCLVFWPMETWLKIQSILDTIPFTERSATALRRCISCGQEVQLDNQGRLNIPPTLRRRGNLNDSVTLLAMGNVMEVWNTQDWQAYDESSLTEANMEKALSDISLLLQGVQSDNMRIGQSHV